MRNDKMLNVKWRYLCGWSAICILWNQNHRERIRKSNKYRNDIVWNRVIISHGLNAI